MPLPDEVATTSPNIRLVVTPPPRIPARDTAPAKLLATIPNASFAVTRTGKDSFTYCGDGMAAQSKLETRPGIPSSLMIVPTPWASASSALVGLKRFTAKVSSFSMTVSPTTLTTIVWLVMPGANVSVPATAV